MSMSPAVVKNAFQSLGDMQALPDFLEIFIVVFFYT